MIAHIHEPIHSEDWRWLRLQIVDGINVRIVAGFRAVGHERVGVIHLDRAGRCKTRLTHTAIRRQAGYKSSNLWLADQ